VSTHLDCTDQIVNILEERHNSKSTIMNQMCQTSNMNHVPFFIFYPALIIYGAVLEIKSLIRFSSILYLKHAFLIEFSIKTEFMAPDIWKQSIQYIFVGTSISPASTLINFSELISDSSAMIKIFFSQKPWLV